MKWFNAEQQKRSIVRAGDISARLPDILLRAQQVAQVLLHGQHGRKKSGSGDHFWQYRAYDPLADAASRIDWRRSAQGDQLFVREREDERPKMAVLWIDPASSMHYNSDPKTGISKFEYSFTLACVLAYVFSDSGEQVAPADKSVSATHTKHVEPLARALLNPMGLKDFADIKNAQIFLFSDFLGTDLSELEKIKRAGIAQNNKLNVIVPLDPAEAEYPFDGHIRFETMNAAQKFETQNAKNLKAEYLNRVKEHHKDIRLIVGQSQVNIIKTDKKYEATALDILRPLV